MNTASVRAEPGSVSITRVDANSIELTWPSVEGVIYRIEGSEDMRPGSWETVGTGIEGQAGSTTYIHVEIDEKLARRHLRVMEEFVLIPEGSFQMGYGFDDGLGWPANGWVPAEQPVHDVYVDAFYMGKHETSKALWNEVQTWGLDHGYMDLAESGAQDKSHGPDHPVHSVNWYDVVKWCNARSEKEGLTPCYRADGTIYRSGEHDNVECDWTVDGYRLPTDAEWEKSARGGFEGRRFPWGDTIDHRQANYASRPSLYGFDVSATLGYHPDYDLGEQEEPGPKTIPHTAPLGSFAANGYGLHDVVGNIREWCWDKWYLYEGASGVDPRNPSGRVTRGSGWSGNADSSRCAYRYATDPAKRVIFRGLRIARSFIQ